MRERERRMYSYDIQDGQVTLNFKQLTKQHSRPRPFIAGPPGIVADSVAREAADRDYQIEFHCHTVPQNAQPCDNQVRHVRTPIVCEQSPDISPGRKHKSKSPTPASQTSLHNHERVLKKEILSLK